MCATTMCTAPILTFAGPRAWDPFVQVWNGSTPEHIDHHDQPFLARQGCSRGEAEQGVVMMEKDVPFLKYLGADCHDDMGAKLMLPWVPVGGTLMLPLMVRTSPVIIWNMVSRAAPNVSKLALGTWQGRGTVWGKVGEGIVRAQIAWVGWCAMPSLSLDIAGDAAMTYTMWGTLP